MKKLINILLSMGVLLMALSCVETNGLDEVPKGEICMSPVLSDMAGTRAGSTTTLDSFRAFAYYSKSAAGQLWADAGEVYFTDHEFKKDNGSYVGDPSVYWPFSGSLIFAGYSSHDEDIVTDYNSLSKTLSIREFDVDGKHDLLYFLPELSDNKYKGDDENTAPVTATFNHALSCVAFTVVEGKGGKTITLKEIKLASVYIKGDMTVGATDPKNVKWENKTTSDLVIWNTGAALSSTALDIESFIIPGQAQNIMVTYRIDGENEDKTKTIEPKEIKDWAAGTRYQYDISINSMGELVLTPTVTIKPVKNNEGKLAGSNVLVNLGDLTEDDLDRISKLKIVVSNGSTVYRTYEQKDGEELTSNILISYDSGLPYLKQGNYQITVSYNDGQNDQTVSVTATPLSPEFTVTVSGSKKSGTHTNTGATISVTSSVSISDNVLKQLPLSDCEVRLSDLATWYIGSANSTTSQFIAKEIEGKWENNYTLTSQVTFDGKTVSASSTTVSLQPSIYKVLDKGTAVVVQKAADLKDGGYYFIRLKESQTRSIWVCNSSTLQLLVNTSYVGDNVFGKEYPNSYVFKFCKLNVSVTDNEYKSVIVGTFRSQYRYNQSSSNCYVTWDDDSVIDFDGSINQNYMLYIANRWGSETDPYMDIYQYKSSNTPKRGSDMLGRVGPNVDIEGGEKADNNIRWGTTFWGANNARKFEFIEIIPQ